MASIPLSWQCRLTDHLTIIKSQRSGESFQEEEFFWWGRGWGGVGRLQCLLPRHNRNLLADAKNPTDSCIKDIQSDVCLCFLKNGLERIGLGSSCCSEFSKSRVRLGPCQRWKRDLVGQVGPSTTIHIGKMFLPKKERKVQCKSWVAYFLDPPVDVRTHVVRPSVMRMRRPYHVSLFISRSAACAVDSSFVVCVVVKTNLSGSHVLGLFPTGCVPYWSALRPNASQRQDYAPRLRNMEHQSK